MISPFTEILVEIIGEIKGSVGVIIQDWDGETIDYFGNMEDDEDLKITGAQWGLIWRMLKFDNKNNFVEEAKEIIIKTKKHIIIINTLFHDYYIVLIINSTTNIVTTSSKLNNFLHRIKQEMGL